jgi:hypothetical protein
MRGKKYRVNGIDMRVVIPPAEAQQGAAESYTFPSSRDMRYCEILVATKDGVQVYNTTGLNDCPA